MSKWTDGMTDEQLLILGDAMRQRRVFMGDLLSASRNKPPAHEYWKTKAGVLDSLIDDVTGAENERRIDTTQEQGDKAVNSGPSPS